MNEAEYRLLADRRVAVNSMIQVAPCRYVNAGAAARLGLRGEPAYELPEPTAEGRTVRRETVKADKDDTPVFDTDREMPTIVDARDGEWHGSCIKGPRGTPIMRYDIDGPSEDHRIMAGQAWYASNRYSGQAANDNQDWPLAKLLRTENNERLLKIAERYRDLWNAAHMPHDMVGRDLADNIYLMVRTDIDESTGHLIDKGIKKVTGKKARLDMPATRATKADPDKTKKRSKPIPRKWNGDWPLLHHIDACRELARAQSALGWLREAFETAVVGGETLEAIGRAHGVGNVAGAKGGGRVLVFLGFQAIDEFWQRENRRAA